MKIDLNNFFNFYDAANEVFQTLITLRPDDDYGKTASARLKRIQKAKP